MIRRRTQSNMPAVRMGDSLRDGKAESGTTAVSAAVVGLRRRAMYEALEQAVTEFRRDAGPFVVHIDVHHLLGGVYPHVNGAGRRRMLQRVVEEVEHQTVQQHAVTVQAKSVGGGRLAEVQRHAARD